MRVLLLVLAAVGAWARPADTNYNESKAGAYQLPDPLVLSNREQVKDVKTSPANASGSSCSADIR